MTPLFCQKKRFYRFSFSSNIPEGVIRIPRKKPQQSPKTITALFISDLKKNYYRTEIQRVQLNHAKEHSSLALCITQ